MVTLQDVCVYIYSHEKHEKQTIYLYKLPPCINSHKQSVTMQLFSWQVTLFSLYSFPPHVKPKLSATNSHSLAINENNSGKRKKMEYEQMSKVKSVLQNTIKLRFCLIVCKSCTDPTYHVVDTKWAFGTQGIIFSLLTVFTADCWWLWLIKITIRNCKMKEWK